MAALRHRGTRAIQHLVEFAPSTGGLALWVHHVDRVDPAAPPVATDGHTLFYGPPGADFLARECARVKDERDELRACVKSFLHSFNAEPWDEDAQDKAEAALWRAVWP